MGLVVTVVAMGALGLGLAVISGRIYRDHAIDNERHALGELLRSRLHEVRARAEHEAQVLARTLGHPSDGLAVSAARQRDHYKKMFAQLSLYRPMFADGSPVVGLFAYDLNRQLLAGYDAAGPVVQAGHWQTSCEHLTVVASGRGKPVSTDCLADNRWYHSVSVSITDQPPAHLQLVVDAAHGLAQLEATIGLPLRLNLPDGSIGYESSRWPDAGAMSSALIAAHDLGVDAYDGGSLIIEIAKDGTALYAKLAQVRDAVFFAAAAVTLLFVLIALALLEKTAISPLRALTGQMRRLRQDESQLGKRVEVMGNAEVAEVAQGFNEMTAKIEKLYENLEHMAFTDPLTQLPNRSLFQERLEQAIAHAQREHQTFALFIMDLDRFKEINDTLGHHIGDLLLQQVAVRLRGKLREIDTLARMGGDEFAVLLPAVTAKQADMAARMLLQSLRTPFVVEGSQLDVRTSVGVALYPDHGVDVNLLTQRADVAMYAAKQSGSGHTFYDEQMDRNHPALLTLMGELRQAVEQEQFVLYFQPKIGLGGNHVVGVEALVRWRHPSGRLIMPETFIPLLEQTGLIRSLTGWVINEALRVGRELRSEGFALPIAVNISARDLQNSCLVEELGEQLAAHQADAHWLELEITESAVMADVEGAVEVLTRLATMGFILVIDDFGTGHSSLAYLKRLPVHIVKIDKSFVHGMARDTNDAAIVYTSIELTHNLGLQVVAEGVDDETVLARLRTHGCDAVQGLYLSRPLSHEELTDWLVKSSWGLPTRLAS